MFGAPATGFVLNAIADVECRFRRSFGHRVGDVCDSVEYRFRNLLGSRGAWEGAGSISGSPLVSGPPHSAAARFTQQRSTSLRSSPAELAPVGTLNPHFFPRALRTVVWKRLLKALAGFLALPAAQSESQTRLGRVVS